MEFLTNFARPKRIIQVVSCHVVMAFRNILWFFNGTP